MAKVLAPYQPSKLERQNESTLSHIGPYRPKLHVDLIRSVNNLKFP